ncbi:Bax inhibitor 1 [Gracilaria domingensis]|nr:Bax inhibitor 1 [Gracilaria domingensis]
MQRRSVRIQRKHDCIGRASEISERIDPIDVGDAPKRELIRRRDGGGLPQRHGHAFHATMAAKRDASKPWKRRQRRRDERQKAHRREGWGVPTGDASEHGVDPANWTRVDRAGECAGSAFPGVPWRSMACQTVEPGRSICFGPTAARGYPRTRRAALRCQPLVPPTPPRSSSVPPPAGLQSKFAPSEMASTAYGYRFSPHDSQPRRRQSMFSSLMSHVDPVVHKHLRRVYTSLTSALFVASVAAIASYLMVLRGTYWVSTLCTFAAIPALLYFSSLSSHSKRRSFAFHLFAFLDGAAIGPLLCGVIDIDPSIPPMAFLGAFLVFSSCSLSAIFAKRKSYLFLGSFLFTALFGMFLMSILGRFLPHMMPVMPFLYMGLFMFCGFVLYDTQMIIEKAHAGDRDHLKHALELFIDFVAIVRHIMVIMANNRQRRQDRDDRRRKSSRN